MKRSVVAVVCGISIMCGSAFAITQNPKNEPIIDLGGGKVKPAAQIKLALEKLVNDVAYDVSCTVIDSNNQKNKAIVSIRTDNTSGAVGRFLLNGVDVGSATDIIQRQLPQVTNSFLATHLYNWCGFLDFTNADQTDEIEVSCKATPSL